MSFDIVLLPFYRGYRIISSIYRRTLSAPLVTITALLYVQTKLLDPVAAAIKYETLDKCLQPAPKNVFANTCQAFDALPTYFDVITNVPRLKDVAYLLFAEAHYSAEDRRSKINWLNRFATPIDIILFEGFDRSSTLQCSTIADDGMSLIGLQVGMSDTNYPTDLIRQGKFKLFGLSDTLTCKGWDDQAAAAKQSTHLQAGFIVISSLKKLFKSLNDTTHSYILKLNDDRKYLSYEDTNKFSKKLMSDLALAMYSDAAKQFLKLPEEYVVALKRIAVTTDHPLTSQDELDKYFADLISLSSRFLSLISQVLNTVDNNLIKLLNAGTAERNKFAFETLTKYKSRQGNKFSIFGSSHLGETFDTNVNKSHCAYEFRKALEELPHAILYRKNNIRGITLQAILSCFGALGCESSSLAFLNLFWMIDSLSESVS